MRQVRLGAVFAWALTLVLVNAPVQAQESKAAAPASQEKSHGHPQADGRIPLPGPAFQCHA